MRDAWISALWIVTIVGSVFVSIIVVVELNRPACTSEVPVGFDQRATTVKVEPISPITALPSGDWCGFGRDL